ncbi:hypothetical protein DHD32_18770 [Arenibacter sp. TNZ]|uniref:hypothetical protein n=1 Tax=Arenibacter TaxID=178469 RepID=UPI000CD47B2B|nr:MULTISPECIES: hypothetical protein [Arenibacter]MCM4173524.1 hypothetical protein [Arenibacter sp. TNZ]
MIVKSKIFYTVLIIAFWQSFGYSQSEKVDYSGFLKNVVESDEKFWVRVHAAEALISNNFEVNVKQLFKNELNGDGVEKIGALRLMARTFMNNGIEIDSIAMKIRYQLEIAKNEHTKSVAIETLGKLGFYLPDERISALARNGEGVLKGMAQWVLANSGKVQDINKLSDLLITTDSLKFLSAAYSLRFIENVSPETYSKMKEKYNSLDKDYYYRVYLVSALYVHAPIEELSILKNELYAYLNGETYERYEVYQALAVRGSEEDIAKIQVGFSEEKDTDVKVSASDAYLANRH